MVVVPRPYGAAWGVDNNTFVAPKPDDSPEMLMLAVPLAVAVVLLVFMCFCCVSQYKRSKKRKDEALRDMKERAYDAGESSDEEQQREEEERAQRRRDRAERKKKRELEKQAAGKPGVLTDEYETEGGAQTHSDGAALPPVEQHAFAEYPHVVEHQDVVDEVGVEGGEFGEEEMRELRIDPTDGNPYDYQSFLEAYGDQDGHFRWEQSAETGQLYPVAMLNDM